MRLALCCCFEDQEADESDRVLQSLQHVEALARSIGPLEIASALLVAERRPRLARTISGRYLDLLMTLPIVIDDDGAATALRLVRSLARDQDRSAQDAAYLELAMRRGLLLGTLDDGLLKSAAALAIAAH